MYKISRAFYVMIAILVLFGIQLLGMKTRFSYAASNNSSTSSSSVEIVEEDWTSEVANKRRVHSTSFAYFNIGLVLQGAAINNHLNGSNMDASNVVITNAFFAPGAMLGPSFRLGVEDFSFFLRNLYVAAELVFMMPFSTDQAKSGLIGSSGDLSQSLDGIGKGNIIGAFMLKAGFSFPAGRIGTKTREAAMYLGVGVSYSYFKINSTKGNATTVIDMSGFGLMLGVGFKINMTQWFELGMEANFIPPIPGGSNCKLDRMPCSPNGSITGYSIISYQTYMLNLTIGIKV